MKSYTEKDHELLAKRKRRRKRRKTRNGKLEIL
jgi:hypothetical protein